ncbi:MAG: tRNA pseudouridine(38-40) synthase TruA [Phycisphaerae bacterium]|nr:tRNA pseudouridine(38-40) synthase TruA [Phycisphaerae bacterium]
MERNIKLVLAYDGTDFHGWQSQAGVRTVQAEVEAVLRRVLRHPLHVQGASRTDAGVHARGQVASVLTTSPIPVENLLRAVGHHLPPDVALVHVAEAEPEFHPSLDALGKLYRYRIFNAVRRPVEVLAGRFAWHVWYPLDLDRMRAAAARLVGTHDFAAFASQGSPRASTVRTVRRIGIRRRVDEVLIDVEGDGFLYNQVRNMVGTLYEVGRGRWPPERIGEILASRSRNQAGLTAPPHGLCLQWVRYGPAGPARTNAGRFSMAPLDEDRI